MPYWLTDILNILMAGSLVSGCGLLVVTLINRFASSLPGSIAKILVELVLYTAGLILPLWVIWSVLNPRTALDPLPGWRPSPQWFVVAWILHSTTLAYLATSFPLWRYRREKMACQTRPCVPFVDTQKQPSGLLGRIPGNGIHDLRLTTIAVPIPSRWNALRGLTIGHISDLHVGQRCSPAFVQYAFDLLAHQSPDLLCLTGDLVNYQRYLNQCLPVLKQVSAPLGKYAVLGNHDYWTDADLCRRGLQATGWRVLGNSCDRLVVDGQTLNLAGVESPWPCRKGSIDFLPDNPAEPTLVLAHSPDEFPRLSRRGVMLVLAGHTHGGQICLPLLGPLVVPSWHGRWYADGIYRRRHSLMVVNRGVGCYPPIRLNCPPEVVLIRLV